MPINTHCHISLLVLSGGCCTQQAIFAYFRHFFGASATMMYGHMCACMWAAMHCRTAIVAVYCSTICWVGKWQEKQTMHLYSPKTWRKKPQLQQTRTLATNNMPIKTETIRSLGPGAVCTKYCVTLSARFIAPGDGSNFFAAVSYILSFSFSFYFSAARLFLFRRPLCLVMVLAIGVFVSREIWPIH